MFIQSLAMVDCRYVARAASLPLTMSRVFWEESAATLVSATVHSMMTTSMATRAMSGTRTLRKMECSLSCACSLAFMCRRLELCERVGVPGLEVRIGCVFCDGIGAARPAGHQFDDRLAVCCCLVGERGLEHGPD